MLADAAEMVLSPVDPSAPAGVTATNPIATPSPTASAARVDRRPILRLETGSFMQTGYAIERRTVRGGHNERRVVPVGRLPPCRRVEDTLSEAHSDTSASPVRHRLPG